MTGQYVHNIDTKNRLFMPAKLRDELGSHFYLTIGQDHCLSVYSEEAWQSAMDKMQDLSYSKVKALRLMFAYTSECEPDSQGRIVVPAKLREYANLEKEVVIVGSFGRVEIWNAQRWAEMEAEAFDSGSLEQAMEEIGL